MTSFIRTKRLVSMSSFAMALLLSVVIVGCGVSDTGPSNVSGDWQIEADRYTRDSTVVSVTFNLTNVDNQAQYPPSELLGSYLVIDDIGREFSPSRVINHTDPVFSFMEVNPGFNVGLTAIFMVPVDATGLVFRFRGGVFSQDVDINLAE